MFHKTFPEGGTRYRIFTAVKYLVFFLLSLNVYFFLRQEAESLKYLFADGVELANAVQVFSATIDTAAWVVLLLLFELETSVIDDERIHGWVKWSLHGLRGLCYVGIVYAFTGYLAELQMLYRVSALSGVDACALVGQGYSILLDLDEYAPLGADNCIGVGAALHQLVGFEIVADSAALQSARWLAWADVINAGNWILVCLLLEIEVRLQLLGQLTDRMVGLGQVVKAALYTVLFAAAAYWGYAGEFLDFWDAALWLFAFLFIELNVFEWQAHAHSAS